MNNQWLNVENIVAKGEIARFEQFLLLSLFSNSRLLQRRQKVSIWGKGLMPIMIVYAMMKGMNPSVLMTSVEKDRTVKPLSDPYSHCLLDFSWTFQYVSFNECRFRTDKEKMLFYLGVHGCHISYCMVFPEQISYLIYIHTVH